MDIKHLKIRKEEFVENEEILDMVNEIEKEYRTTKDLKKDYPKEIKKLEEALLKKMGEKEFKIF